MITEIPADVREFLKAYVTSYEQLEILLLMHRDQSPWTAEAVSEQLGLPLEAAADAMTRLWRAGLVEARTVGARRSGFVYAPANEQSRRSVDALAATYASHRFDVVQLMGSLAIERMRNATAHHFADAFVLKSRTKKDG